ncbi:DUF4214 domain-containing protein [Halarcobacter sp.]|uniref:DUF4214 domain-containing protein n=1 Tax=Halarcobacter sp. TaxID=2321133 RepID=UPI0029F49AE3|nr:DUF4214 domain-containing protein [Halarcobacter sp.]
MTNEMKHVAIYEAFSGDNTPTAEEIYEYYQLGNTQVALVNMIEDSAYGTAFFADTTITSLSDKLEILYNQILGRDSDAEGKAYWLGLLEDGSETLTSIASSFLDGAVASGEFVEADYEDLAADLAAYEPDTTPVEEEGQTYELTSGTDKGADFTGTDDKDTFDASIVQNAFSGGVSNSLSSADKLDGGAGTDTLNAELVAEFVGSTSDYQIDVQPQTKDIEIVTFEARDSGSNDTETIVTSDANGNLTFSEVNANSLITVDAKYMTGLDKIGSLNSDGDLIIENLTTLDDNGNARNTEELTITMDHTDNFNSDRDASDLTVYFDEDYLLTGETTQGASLTIRLLNAVQNEAGNNPVEGFSEITFNVGDTEVAVDITSVSTDTTQDFTTAYSAIVSLINAKLDELGFDDVRASAPNLEDAVFSIPVAGFTTGDDAGDYYPIIVKNSGSEALTGVDIATSALQYDTDLNNSFSTVAPETSNDPVTVNVELNKVGREGEGGDLIIGGKELDSNTPDTTEGNGIDTFNITVLGNESKLSNLGTIDSTNGALRTVNIASEARTDSYASLTIRDAFGGTLDTLNANNFKGDLLIGTDAPASINSAAHNIDTFTATGGGDVTLNEVISADGAGAGSFESLDNNAYSVTTAGGSDTINVDANSGAQLTVSTGANDDTIAVSIDGQDDSGSTLTKAFITSTSGDNKVEVTSSDSAHEADITLGSGADTVTGNTVNITVSTGAGNDTIYTSNTAQKAVIVNAAADNTITGATTIAGNTGATPDQSELLYGRSVVVTLATAGVTANDFTQGYESISVDIEASNGYLTTTADLHNAIAEAINTDPVLSELAEATVDSNGTLVVSYKIDGAIDVVAAPAIEYTISGDWADLDPNEQNGILSQLEVDYSDSDLVFEIADGANSLEAAYATANITTAQAIDDNGNGQNGLASASGDNNVVNAGLGDDVIVLSSDDNATDTIEIDANGFGNDVVVHFEVGANGDVIDFAHLDNVTSASGSSVSEIDVAGTVVAATAITANSVVAVALTDLTDNDAGATAAMTFDSLSNSGVLAEINAGADFGVSGTPADFVGNLVNSVFMVEDDTNDGYYKVFEVVYNTDTTKFTEATLVGTLDFEASVTLTDDNIA